MPAQASAAGAGAAGCGVAVGSAGAGRLCGRGLRYRRSRGHCGRLDNWSKFLVVFVSQLGC